MLWIIVPFVLFILSFNFIFNAKQTSKGYTNNLWTKIKFFVVFLVLKWIYRNRKKRTNDHEPFSDDLYKIGFLPSLTERKLENIQKLENIKEADGISFVGIGSEGEYLFIRIIRRSDGRKEMCMYVNLKDGSKYILDDSQHVRLLNDAGSIDTISNCQWSAGGLKVTCKEPMRRWKILFNGLVKNAESEDDIKHLKLRLTWISMTKVIDFQESLCQIAEGLAEEPIFKALSNISNVLSNLDVYEQGGYFSGTYRLEENEENEIIMRGIRSRLLGKFDTFNKAKDENMAIYTEDGDIYRIGVMNISNTISKLKYGYKMNSNTFDQVLKGNSLDFDDQLTNPDVTTLDLSVISGGKLHKISMARKKNFTRLKCGKELESVTTVQSSDFIVNGRKASGMTFSMINGGQENFQAPKTKLSNEETENIYHTLPRVKSKNSEKLVLQFNEDDCCLSEFVGGKGSSLASLKNLQIRTKEKYFTVPRGCCITVKAFEDHLNQNRHIADNVKDLEFITRKVVKKDIKEETEKLTKLIKETKLSEILKKEIFTALKEVFGENFQDSLRIAIRSSAVGEDSEEMSAAGQLSTFLGIRSLENIYQSVIDCWASLFSFQAVQYHRQYGQFINPGMGVVLQEMVKAEAAGVMFTNDPVTENPSLLAITANYGLGESVVSASADPDTIILKRSTSNDLSIFSKTVGKKNVMINMNADNGIVEEEIENSEEFSISDDVSIKLGKIGLMVELYFRNPRDIEWAVVNGDVYLLQARPITSFDLETDYELIHELDSPIRSKHDRMTRANIGEVLPYAASPLALSFSIRLMNIGIARSFQVRESFHLEFVPYCDTIMPSFYRSVFLNLIDCFYRSNQDKESSRGKAMQVAVFGRILNDKTVHDFAKQRYGIISFKNKFLRSMYTFYDVWRNKTAVEDARKMYKSYNNDWDSIENPLDLYKEIVKKSIDLIKVFVNHGNATVAAVIFNLMILISSGRKDWDLDDYTDMAKLLESCNEVESAGVPLLMQEIAEAIAEECEKEEFVNKSVEDALEWIKTKGKKSSEKFNQFLATHGHRCIAEFDVMSVSWGMDPSKLVKSLQIMVQNDSAKKKPAKKSIDEILSSLKKPLSNTTKRFFKWLLPKCRDAVGCREQTKSMLILVIDSLRRGFRRLGHLMERDGFIPDSELVFFFTHVEIEKFLLTRNPRIISRANRRRRLHDKLNDLEFSEISIGYPKPIEQETYDIDNSSIAISGTPVCNGSIKAVARVVTSLSQASEIKPGDILITKATDIGWSPYFPLLGGVVTELGGLISHGAVVARESGLPCLVGAKGATSFFKSGDVVFLNSTKGTIQRIE